MNDVISVVVPLPPEAVGGSEWDVHDSPPSRAVYGRNRKLEGTTIELGVAAVQDCRGHIDTVTDPPYIDLDGKAFSAQQIRAFAALFSDAADELDRWTAWATANNRATQHPNGHP